MNKQPAITVFMPVYNAEKYLKEAIDSILNQTFENFELLIIDDGSTDESVKIIETYTDQRIRLIHNDGNKGLPYTRNRGLNLARGKYLAIMDADDVSVKNRLEIEYNIMEKRSNLAVISSGKELLSNAGKSTYGWKEKLYSWIFYRKSSQIQMDLIFHNVLVNSCSMIRMDFLKNNKILYNEKCFVMQDYEIWTQISAKQGQFQIVRKALVQYRSHQDNISNRSRKDKAAQRRNIQFYIQEKYLKQVGLDGENDISEYLKIYGKEYEETSECIDDNYMYILKGFYEGLLENSKSSEIISYQELKKYLRKRYFLYALKCNGNKLGQCIESFKLK